MPASRWTAFLAERIIEGTMSPEPVATELLERHKKDPHNETSRQDLQTFCAKIVPHLQTGARTSGYIGYPPEYLSSRRATSEERYTNHFKAPLIACCAWLGNDKLCGFVLSLIEGDIPRRLFSELGKPVLRSGKFAQFQDFLLSAVLRNKDITDVWSALEYLTGPSNRDGWTPNASFEMWCVGIINTKLSNAVSMSSEDARALASISHRYGAGPSGMYEKK